MFYLFIIIINMAARQVIRGVEMQVIAVKVQAIHSEMQVIGV